MSNFSGAPRVFVSNETDDALLARYRAGDQQAFGDLVIRYQRALYNAALWIVRNADDARDVTQEVFLKVAVRLDGIRPPVQVLQLDLPHCSQRVAQPPAPKRT